MDTGRGTFEQFESVADLKEAYKNANIDECFEVGEKIRIKNSWFKVRTITPKKLVLRLLSREKKTDEREVSLEEYCGKLSEYHRVNQELAALMHFQAIVKGMWATDRPDLLTDEEKERCHLFEIK